MNSGYKLENDGTEIGTLDRTLSGFRTAIRRKSHPERMENWERVGCWSISYLTGASGVWRTVAEIHGRIGGP